MGSVPLLSHWKVTETFSGTVMDSGDAVAVGGSAGKRSSYSFPGGLGGKAWEYHATSTQPSADSCCYIKYQIHLYQVQHVPRALSTAGFASQLARIDEKSQY